MRCQNRASLDGVAGLVTVAVLDSPPSALRLHEYANEWIIVENAMRNLLFDVTDR